MLRLLFQRAYSKSSKCNCFSLRDAHPVSFFPMTKFPASLRRLETYPLYCLSSICKARNEYVKSYKAYQVTHVHLRAQPSTVLVRRERS